jgi:indolepyruvate ferredoxin oxidoreductase alpha subunit
MTGFQPSFTGADGDEGCADKAASPGRLSIEDAVRGLGVKEVFSVNQFDEEATLVALKLARAGEGVNVVVCNAACAVEKRRLGVAEKRPPFTVDQELCNACSLCVRVLGCPAILVENGQYTIDPSLCDGCELCARVCRQDAIIPVEDNDRV